MFALVLVQIHRMQAIGRMQAGLRSANGFQLGPAGGIDRWHDLVGNTCRTCTCLHSGAIGVELCGIEMAVAVDQTHG